MAELRQLWNIDLDNGLEAARRTIRDSLHAHISQLVPRPARQQRTPEQRQLQYRHAVAASFGIPVGPALENVKLKDRRAWLTNKDLGIKKIASRTSQRDLEHAIAQLADRLANGLKIPRVNLATPPTAITRPTPQPVSLLAHLVSLSGAVRHALETARDACRSQGRAFYTFDLLLAILDMPTRRVTECFEVVGTGLAEKSREELLAMPDPGKTQHSFVPFEWAERSDVQLAWQHALQDGAPAITELHLLLAILDGQSETNRWLQRFLGEDYYPTLRVTADRMRRGGPPEIKSPTPD